MKRQKLKSAQPDFILTGAESGLLESGLDHFTLSILKYNKILEKLISIITQYECTTLRFFTKYIWLASQKWVLLT